MILTKTIWLGTMGGLKKVYIVCIQLTIMIFTEMSAGASHNFTAMATQFSMSSRDWIPGWKNAGDDLQTERIPRTRTSLSPRGSGRIRLALGRAATRLVTPDPSISRRRRAMLCNGSISRTRKVEKKKEYTLPGSHDLAMQSESPTDPMASASETELNLVSKSNMHERHWSSQVQIVRARSKLWREVQNLPQVRIDRLPQGRPQITQYLYRPVIPRMVYAHYPNYKERSRAVKQMRIWFS